MQLKHLTDTADVGNEGIHLFLRVIQSEGSTHGTKNTQAVH